MRTVTRPCQSRSLTAYSGKWSVTAAWRRASSQNQLFFLCLTGGVSVTASYVNGLFVLGKTQTDQISADNQHQSSIWPEKGCTGSGSGILKVCMCVCF